MEKEKKDPGGLSAQEAESRIAKYGYNTLPEKPPPTSFFIFISQFKNPLVYVLLTAGIVTLFLREYSDTAIIFFVVFVNSVLGFIQEKRASNALSARRSMILPMAQVIRDGVKQKIDIKLIVPGDIVVL